MPDTLQIKPLVSFVIPAYNPDVQMLRTCVESVLRLNLTADEREVIVVDDGSDAPVAEVLECYGTDVVCRRQNNAGLSAARNMGLEYARGEYVQFVDSDDYLRFEAYSLCLEMLRKKSPDVLLFRHTHTETAMQPWQMSDAVSGSTYLRTRNLRAAACCYLFRRDILGELRFRPGIFHEDEEFTPQLFLRAKRLVEMTVPAYFYRIRTESIVHNRSRRMVVRRLCDFRSVIVVLKKLSATLCGEEREAMERRVAQLTMDFLYKTVCETRSLCTLRYQIAWLRHRHLFPLPYKKYSRKYAFFSALTRIWL